MLLLAFAVAPLRSRGPQKWYGRKGQTMLQVGASVSLLIVFVAIPTCRNYIKEWRKRTVDVSASRTYIHEEVTKVRMEWRRELAAKMEREAKEGGGRPQK